MNVEKQVAYWREGSKEDLEVASILLGQGKVRHALFFAHLAMEKALKALVVKYTGAHPPRLHSLVLLAERAGITLEPSGLDFLAAFDIYQMEGRYPGSSQETVDRDTARHDFARSQEVHTWLISKL